MIFWVNAPFDPLPGEGGRPLRYWLLSRALVAAGHDVVWWGSDFHHLTKRTRDLAAAYEKEGICVRLVPTLPYTANVGWQRWRSHMRYARDWEALARAAVAQGQLKVPDCMVVSMPPLGLYEGAANLRKDWACKVVVDIQDAWPETFYQLLPAALRGLGKVLLGPLHRLAVRAYRGADGVSAVCDRYVGLARDAGSTRPAGVFRLGCPLSQDVARPNPGKMLRLCYIGNLGKSYDLRTVAQGVAELAAAGLPVTLDIAGEGPQRGWVAAAAAAGSGVRFHGYMDNAGMQSLLKDCDVGLVPMRAESWVAVPNKVTDYAAAGLAMINGLEGETRALLTEYEAGLAYACGDVASFKQAVNRYADDCLLLGRHQKGARHMAETLFDPNRIYPEMAAWLAALVTRNVEA